MREIKTADDLLDVIETRRQASDKTFRAVARDASTAPASFWLWRKRRHIPRLDNALAYAASVGLKVYVE